MKTILFLMLLLAFASCQIDGLDPLNTRTVVPDVNARIARRLSVSVDGKTVYSEEKYVYNAAGQLERINGYYRTSDGQPNLSYYQTYAYNADGTLAHRIDFTRSSNAGDFRISYVRNYSYPAVDRVVEDAFLIEYPTNKQMIAGRTETFRENGLPLKMVQYYPNSSQQLILQNTTTYTYKAERLVKEEFINAIGTLYSTQEYNYKGRRAQVISSSPSYPQSYPVRTLEYDRQGRLIRQQFANQGFYLSSSSYLSLSSSSIPAITIFEYDN